MIIKLLFDMELLSDSEHDIKIAAKALAGGALVAFPTETVYGLGADAFNTKALARVFEAKNRPHFDPLIIHIANTETLSLIADIKSLAKPIKEKLNILTKRLWPGPLTLVLPKKAEIPDLATSGLPTLAVRFPSHPVAQKLICLAAIPVAAPSANPFGRLSPTRADHVREQLGGRVDFIIDGGRTDIGLESTVLDLTHNIPRILRPGGIPQEVIESLIGEVELVSHGEESTSQREVLSSKGEAPASQGEDITSPREVISSPGMLKNHYAPCTPIVIHKSWEMSLIPDAVDEGRLYFSVPDKSQCPADRTRVLSLAGDLQEAAANFFDMLHELDSLGLSLIRAEEAPSNGLGTAINDRLRRASFKAC